MNNTILKHIFAAVTAVTLSCTAWGQAMYLSSARVSDIIATEQDKTTPPEDFAYPPADSLYNISCDTVMVLDQLPRIFFTEPVFTTYVIYDKPYDPFAAELSGNPALDWIERDKALYDRRQRYLQTFFIARPDLVRRNIATMAKPPRQFYGVVNPKDHTIELREVNVEAPKKIDDGHVEKRHWLRTFQAGLQFSQAYVSPNWYQGGNNNLNMIANIYYNVKLNPAYHQNLLFESTMQYKLGMNSAPDDSLRNYSISEDLLQMNMTFGVKAVKHWYYSLTAQFKTQVLTSYVKNKRDISSAFLSPGEFTAGVGMTYDNANKKKTFTFDASVAPLSYNMKICIKDDKDLAHSQYDIDPDKHYVMNFGSSAEAKILWKICDNISLRSRLFVFTDYNYFQGDWENTLNMDINRYLSTQLYVHARYDTSTPRCDDPDWHKLQVKEILSFGVTYKFSSI